MFEELVVSSDWTRLKIQMFNSLILDLEKKQRLIRVTSLTFDPWRPRNKKRHSAQVQDEHVGDVDGVKGQTLCPQ